MTNKTTDELLIGEIRLIIISTVFPAVILAIGKVFKK